MEKLSQAPIALALARSPNLDERFVPLSQAYVTFTGEAADDPSVLPEDHEATPRANSFQKRINVPRETRVVETPLTRKPFVTYVHYRSYDRDRVGRFVVQHDRPSAPSA